MRVYLLLIIIISGISLLGAQSQPLPPPNSNFALAVLAPVDHTWKVIVRNTTSIIQAAPNSPLLLYYSSNDSITVLLDAKIYTFTPNGSRIYITDKLSPGIHTVQTLNLSITIYVLSEAEEFSQAINSPSLDPWRYKWVYAILASITAVIIGYPLGAWLKRVHAERKSKGVEEL